jgi:putative FmdB family regulatory protein
MPTYEYVCDACGHEYERFQSITASPDRTCPKCGKRKVRRKIGIGAGVLFKGTGFYETDYRSDGYSKAAEADRKSSETPKADATKKEGGEAPKADASAPKSDAPKTSPAAKPAKESRVKALHPSREGRGQGNLRRAKPAPKARARRKGGILKKFAIVAVVAVVALVIGVMLAIDSIARVGIEVVGSKVLGVSTTVESVRLGLLVGRSSVRGVKVANPKGYTDPIFLDLGNASLTARLGELTAERTTIRNITISDLTLTLEQDASGKLNAQRISDNLPDSGPADTSKPDPKAGPSRDIVVKELRIERVTVRLRNLVGGRQGVVDAKLPDIVLKDVHSDGTVDVLASEISGVVISSVLQATLQANIEGLSGAVADGVRDTLKDMVSDLPTDLQGPVESIRGGVGEALDKAGQSIEKGVGSALQGLFGDKPASK